MATNRVTTPHFYTSISGARGRHRRLYDTWLRQSTTADRVVSAGTMTRDRCPLGSSGLLSDCMQCLAHACWSRARVAGTHHRMIEPLDCSRSHDTNEIFNNSIPRVATHVLINTSTSCVRATNSSMTQPHMFASRYPAIVGIDPAHYVIASPLVRRARLALPRHTTGGEWVDHMLTIVAVNNDAHNVYVVSASLDGVCCASTRVHCADNIASSSAKIANDLFHFALLTMHSNSIRE